MFLNESTKLGIVSQIHFVHPVLTSAATDALVMLPVLVVEILAVRLGAVHTIQTEPVEIVLGIGFGFEDRGLPVHLATTAAGRLMRVLEVSEAVDDLLNGRVANNIFDGEYINFCKGVEVAA